LPRSFARCPPGPDTVSGRPHRNRGDQDGIIAVLREAIRVRPDHAWSHEALSAALQARGDRDGAIAEIREAIRLNPEEQAYRTQLSALLKSQKDSTMPSP
jgi:Flp pilus assembly protein TadD